MPKVIVPNLPTRFDQATQKRVPSIDINSASRYGSFEFLVKDFDGDTETALPQVASRMTDLEGQDYLILCVGDVIIIAAAIAYANEAAGFARLLRWNRHSKSYNIVEAVL